MLRRCVVPVLSCYTTHKMFSGFGFAWKSFKRICEIQFLHTIHTIQINFQHFYQHNLHIAFGECWAQHIFYKVCIFFCIYSLKSSSQHLFSFILIRMKYMHKSKYANRIQCMVWFLQFGINTYWLLLKFNFLNFELLLKISSLKYVQIIGTILINQQKAFWFRRIV